MLKSINHINGCINNVMIFDRALSGAGELKGTFYFLMQSLIVSLDNAYTYDALGRRIQKDDKIAGEKTRYYNNHNWQVLAEYDDNGYHLRSYIYGNYIDEVLVKLEDSDEIYYAHNHLYSPTALSN